MDRSKISELKAEILSLVQERTPLICRYTESHQDLNSSYFRFTLAVGLEVVTLNLRIGRDSRHVLRVKTPHSMVSIHRETSQGFFNVELIVAKILESLQREASVRDQQHQIELRLRTIVGAVARLRERSPENVTLTPTRDGIDLQIHGLSEEDADRIFLILKTSSQTHSHRSRWDHLLEGPED
jgi:hypothetical protein